ncbi:hypothetical protein AZSI13_32560 [Azospira sp. I13]|uniref:ExeA family protein n=1 Tax=Azospira sp. I13 TaxID=1765050 RepID=UPI000D4DCAA6|nr:AAA family ATPase [Azospira sp. I13]GBG03929.1 hypothetical protein AZSI13_32560 [Azospira sp. I13]
MPLKLKGVLARNGIRHSELCDAVKQKDGKPMSSTGLSLIANWNTWPKNTPKESLQQQTRDFLTSKGVSEEEIATAFDVDGEDSHRHAHPIGIHVGQKHKKPEPEIEPLEIEMLNPAAKRHFGIFRDPFQADVNGPEDVFLASDQRYIREAMFQTARHGGFLAVVGESGAGKSVLRRDLLDRIAREGHPISVIYPMIIDKKSLTPTSIGEAIIKDLVHSAKVPRTKEGQARLLNDLLLGSSRAGNSHVLIIEEAHDIPTECLKQLKRFWELEDGFKRLLSIVLVGQPELKQKLDERVNWEAREVIRRCEIAELQPLGNNLKDYLQHKFKRIDVALDKVMAPDSFDAIYARLTRVKPGSREVLSQLYPLVVNNLVTKAMNRAAELGIPQVTGDLVKEL